MKKIIFLILMVFSTVFGSSAYALCTQADTVGVWRVYGEFNNNIGRCTIVIASNGAVAASSSCYIPGVVAAAPLLGRLFYQTNCHVFGQLTLRGTTSNVDAWISKGKDSISGMIWSSATNGHSISGVKQ
jgi:hypothetical protein